MHATLTATGKPPRAQTVPHIQTPTFREFAQNPEFFCNNEKLFPREKHAPPCV
jgi:hypothetical protein